MTEEVKNFIGRLTTVKNKAFEERVTAKCIYERAARGMYKSIKIDGIMFIVEDE